MENHRRRGRRCNARVIDFSSFMVFSYLLITPTLSAYVPVTNILLNCGGSENVTQDGRIFVADMTNSDDYRFTGPAVNLTKSSEASDASTSSFYLTARLSSSLYSYGLSVKSTGTHFLRLHFSPFATTSAGEDYDLNNATFSVSVNDTFSLLTNFSPSGSSTPDVKEYLLWVSSDDLLNLTFTPAGDSIAFINAIELFTAPDDFIRSNVSNFIPERGRQDLDGLATNNALETVFRINAGGPLVAESSDTLWRTWYKDDRFLFRPKMARRVNETKRMLYMNNSISAREFAPDLVYSTANTMNADEYQGSNFNLTWNFTVTPDHLYLVRMHFCDLNVTKSDDLYFNVFVNNMFAKQNLHPADYTNGNFFTPFFLDNIVAVGATGMVRISVGRSNKMSNKEANAFLNGVEIMKLNNSAGSFGELSSFGESHSNGSNRAVVITAAVAGVVVLLIVIVGVLVLLLHKRKKRGPPGRASESSRGRGESTGMDSTSINGKSVTITGMSALQRVHHCLHFSLKEMKSATKNFDDSLVIGTGGFGNVYYGQLRNGIPVAVKRGTSASKQGNPEFQNEVNLLSQIRHRHLVSLIGFSDESNQMILVYEYMNKGTLRSHLYDRNDGAGGGNAGKVSNFLSWKQRLKICIGSARGLHYLHTGYSPGIIHRDVKSSNILLTAEEGESVDDCLAKLSDFGLSKVGPNVGETHVSTAVKGSFGYLDPEYFKTQKLTEKSDVYSFGVVLFEVLCARPAIYPKATREEANLAEWAVGKQRAGQLDDIVDRRLKGTVNTKSLRKFGETAEKCLAESGWERPTMGNVLWNLEYALQLQETETRKEVRMDSVASDALISAPVVENLGQDVLMTHKVGGGVGESTTVSMTDSAVFSQLVTGDGR